MFGQQSQQPAEFSPLFEASCPNRILHWTLHVWKKWTTNKVEAIRGRSQSRLEWFSHDITEGRSDEHFSNYCNQTGESRSTPKSPKTPTAHREKQEVNFSRRVTFTKKRKKHLSNNDGEKELIFEMKARHSVGWLVRLQPHSKPPRHEFSLLLLIDVSLR